MVEEIVSRRNAAEHIAHARGGVLLIARTFGLRSTSNGSPASISLRRTRMSCAAHAPKFNRPFERSDKEKAMLARFR